MCLFHTIFLSMWMCKCASVFLPKCFTIEMLILLHQKLIKITRCNSLLMWCELTLRNTWTISCLIYFSPSFASFWRFLVVSAVSTVWKLICRKWSQAKMLNEWLICAIQERCSGPFSNAVRSSIWSVLLTPLISINKLIYLHSSTSSLFYFYHTI